MHNSGVAKIEQIANEGPARLMLRDFRFFLQDELSRRCARNPKYSLRSFAKQLEVSPSALSSILRGKRPVTHKMKEHMGLRLGLDIDTIKTMRSKPHGNSKADITDDGRDLYQQITTDTFSVISEPHYYALLELMKTRDFNWEHSWLAKRLNITVSQVQIAIERLQRVGLLALNEFGELVDTSSGFTTDIQPDLSTQAQRQFQVRAHAASIDAINTVSPASRDNTSIVMAINSRDLILAKEIIKKFRRYFCKKMESNAELDEVYQLVVSFIPISSK